jgi:hypothetical protein
MHRLKNRTCKSAALVKMLPNDFAKPTERRMSPVCSLLNSANNDILHSKTTRAPDFIRLALRLYLPVYSQPLQLGFFIRTNLF